MRASELNSGMNVIEIIDEYFQTIPTFSPDHGNIIDISPLCVRLPRGVSESVGFEHTNEKVSKRRSHFSTHSSTMDLKIMLLVKCEGELFLCKFSALCDVCRKRPLEYKYREG